MHALSLQALCAAPGEALGFEREFVNSSGAPTWFQLDVRQAGGAAGAAAAADLSLVTDAAEWGGLAPAAQLAGAWLRGWCMQRDLCCSAALRSPSSSLPTSCTPPAGLTCPPDGARPITAAQFQLAPQERCLLRFRLHRSLQATGSGALLWHEISIRPLGAAPGPHDSSHPAAPAAAVCRVAAHLLPEPAAHRTLRLHCPAPQGGNTTVQHSVALDQLPGADALLAAGPALCWACSAPGAASAALDRGRLVLTCQAPQAGTTSSFLLAACSSGSASPLEVWEVFLHALPLLRLQAGVGSTATASWLLPPLEHAGPGARQLALHWRCAGAGELQASVGSGPSTAATAGGAKLVLSYTPASVGRRELLLSAVAAPASGSGWAQQAALLLVALDSRGTRVSRSFAVAVPAGQAASKKVRYTSPHPQPRRFAARSLAPGALRVAPAAAAGFVLGGGEEAAIRLTLDAAACAGGLVGPPNEAGQYELLAVVESWPAGGSSGGGGSGAEAGGGRVEEVFCVLLSLAD